MDQVLRKLYYQNLKGFGSAKDLWKLANTKFKITQKQAKEFLDKQENQQRYKKSAGFGDLFVPVTADNYTYQCDLMFLTPEKGDNSGPKNAPSSPLAVRVNVHLRTLPRALSCELAVPLAIRSPPFPSPRCPHPCRSLARR